MSFGFVVAPLGAVGGEKGLRVWEWVVFRLECASAFIGVGFC